MKKTLILLALLVFFCPSSSMSMNADVSTDIKGSAYSGVKAPGIGLQSYEYKKDYSDKDNQTKFGETVNERVGLSYQYAEKVTYILAGVGILYLVLMATFGKFQWKMFFAIGGGLFVLAGFQAIIYFLN